MIVYGHFKTLYDLQFINDCILQKSVKILICENFTTKLQLFYHPLDFFRDYPSKPAPER